MGEYRWTTEVALMKCGHPALLGLMLAALALASCGKQESSSEATGQAIAVAVSIPPQAFLVERIGGEHVAVQVLVGPGQSPATYEPTAKQMATLGEADTYFRIGVPFEETLMPKIAASHPGLDTVDLRQNIELLTIDGHEHHEHDGAMDPHTWLDPERASEQARTIARELIRLDPTNTQTYEANLAELETELDDAAREMEAILAPHEGKTMLVFHPSFGYLADACGLKQIAIESEGKGPNAKQLGELVTRARTDGVSAVFVQQEFASDAVDVLAQEMGARVVVLDPLARDYVANLTTMAQEIARGLSSQAGP